MSAEYHTRLKEWYAREWVRVDQLQRYVLYGALTPEEYEDIVGEPYEAPEA